MSIPKLVGVGIYKQLFIDLMFTSLLIGKTSNINFDQKNNNNINKKINLGPSLNQNEVIILNLQVTGLI